MRRMRHAWTFVLAIVLALAFASPASATNDAQFDTLITQAADFSPEIVSLQPAVDVGATVSDTAIYHVGAVSAVATRSHVAAAGSPRVDATEHLADWTVTAYLDEVESVYNRAVGYHLLNFKGTRW